MNKILLTLVAIVVCAVETRAQDIVLAESPDWTQVDIEAAQSQASQVGGRVIDGSQSEIYNLYASIFVVPTPEMSPGFAVGVAEGHEKSVVKAGGRVISRKRVTKFSLPGYLVTAEAGENRSVMYFLFSTERLYSIAFRRAGALTSDDPGIESYLKRVHFPATGVVAAQIDAIDRNSMSFKVGRFVGYIVGGLCPIIGIAAIGIPVWLVSRRKRKAAQPGATDNPGNAQ